MEVYYIQEIREIKAKYIFFVYGWLTIPLFIWLPLLIIAINFNSDIIKLIIFLIIFPLTFILLSFSISTSLKPSESINNLVPVSNKMIFENDVLCQIKTHKVGQGKIYFFVDKIIYIPILDSIARKGNSILIINTNELNKFKIIIKGRMREDLYLFTKDKSVKFYIDSSKLEKYMELLDNYNVKLFIEGYDTKK